MKILATFLFMIITIAAGASTFSRDTIDNWQVYNGVNLLFAGNGHQTPLATLKKSEIKDLAIKFNHCQAYSNLDVTLELIDESNNTVIRKEYRINSNIRMAIRKADLQKMNSSTYKIRYRENIKNGTDIILGQIKLVD